MKKKLLTLAAICVLLLCVFPMSASAKPIPVAQVGNATFNTLTEAVQVANQYPGSTIELLTDAKFDSTMVTFVDLTVNLNGHTITRTDKTVRWYVGGIEEPEDVGGTIPETVPVVVINDGVMLDAEDATGDISTPLVTAQYADITLNNVTIYNDTFDQDASAFCLRDGATGTLNNSNFISWCGVKIYREVGTAPTTLTVNGGTIISGCLPEAPTQGSALLVEDWNQFDSTIILNNVTIRSENTAALATTRPAYVTIKDSTLVGATGIYMKVGSLDIENSTIVGIGPYAEVPQSGKDTYSTKKDANVFDGSAILFDSANENDVATSVNISADTTLLSANGYAIREVGGIDEAASLINLQVAEGAQLGAPQGDIALLSTAE